MAIAGTLTYDTKLDTSDYQKGLDKLSANTIAKGTLMADAFKMVASKIVDVAKSGIEYNATIEQLTTSFEVMTGSADKATSIVEKLKKMGAETPFEFTDLADATNLLMSFGFESDNAIDTLSMLGDISQGSADKLNTVARAFGKMSSSQKVSLEDINMMIDSGFNPLQEITETTGESMKSLYDRISKGTMSVDEITKSMQRSTSEGGKYYQSMEKQSQTLNGQLSTLQDNWSNLTGNLAKGVTDALTNSLLPTLNDLLSNTEKYEDVLVLVGIAIGTVTALIIAYNIQQALATAGLTLWGAICGIATGVTTALGAAFAFLVSPIGLTILAIGAVIAIGYLLIKHWDEVKAFAVNIFTSIKDFFVDIFTVKIPEAINAVIEFFKKLPEYIGFMIGFIIGSIANFFINLWNFATVDIPNFIGKVIEWFAQLPGRIANLLSDVWNKIKDLGNRLWGFVTNDIPNFINSIIEWFKKLPNEMISIGKNIVDGIWKGITNAKDWLIGKIKQFCSGITDGIKSALGIHSPSRVMADEVGKFIPAGIGVGIEANTDSALKSIDEMNDEIMNKMRQAVNIETAKSSFSSTSGSVSQILSANSVIQVENNNTLELDGEKVYENQQKVTRNKNLQYGFGGAY